MPVVAAVYHGQRPNPAEVRSVGERAQWSHIAAEERAEFWPHYYYAINERNGLRERAEAARSCLRMDEETGGWLIQDLEVAWYLAKTLGDFAASVGVGDLEDK
jgi:predicted Fe-S protein YdhL (DUF1289 family)